MKLVKVLQSARGWSSLWVSPGLGLNQGGEQKQGMDRETEQQEAEGGEKSGSWTRVAAGRGLSFRDASTTQFLGAGVRITPKQ